MTEKEKLVNLLLRGELEASNKGVFNCTPQGEFKAEIVADFLLQNGVSVIPIKHGHIVWKEYHKGGIRRRKCLQEIKSVYIEQQMPCKHIAIVDERYLSKDPYCSECGMLLGEFLSYCGNCGAKMDGGDSND